MTTNMPTPVSEHEKLFDEICNKLNELSGRPLGEIPKSTPEEAVIEEASQTKYEKMQNQMNKFQNDLLESHEELREKMKTFESSSTVHNEVSTQLRQLTEQLGLERANNSKLSSDLAKSLELCLQLQLEIQGLKGRGLQMQNEERKYSQALLEKNKSLQKDLELLMALKEELAMELSKAKSAFSIEQNLWEEQQNQLQSQIEDLQKDKLVLHSNVSDLELSINDKSKKIAELYSEVDNLSDSFSKVELTTHKQGEVMKDLMGVAENKIIEMKLALDKKQLESQDYYNHLQHSLTQLSIFKQENLALKDYINKLNVYHQQATATGQVSHAANNNAAAPVS